MSIKFSYHAIERFAERFPKKADRMMEIFNKAKIYNGWRNNTRLMTTLMRKYGDRVAQEQVRIAEGIAFVISPNHLGELYVATCVSAERYFDSRPTQPWRRRKD